MFGPGFLAHKFPKMHIGDGEKHYYFITPQIGPHEKPLRILQDLRRPLHVKNNLNLYAKQIPVVVSFYRQEAWWQEAWLHDRFLHPHQMLCLFIEIV